MLAVDGSLGFVNCRSGTGNKAKQDHAFSTQISHFNKVKRNLKSWINVIGSYVSRRHKRVQFNTSNVVGK